jgi:hypothetical protein
MNINLSGDDMHLACPPGNLNITDFSWQLASRLRYTCWDGVRHVPLLDLLVSPANGLDKIDTTSIARGDGSTPPASLTEQQQRQKPWQTKQAAIAGAVVGAVLGVGVVGALLWFIVGRRLVASRKGQAFKKFQDDHAAAAATAGGDTGPASSTHGAEPINRGNSSSTSAPAT